VHKCLGVLVLQSLIRDLERGSKSSPEIPDVSQVGCAGTPREDFSFRQMHRSGPVTCDAACVKITKPFHYYQACSDRQAPTSTWLRIIHLCWHLPRSAWTLSRSRQVTWITKNSDIGFESVCVEGRRISLKSSLISLNPKKSTCQSWLSK
jgi:hypothetical protein